MSSVLSIVLNWNGLNYTKRCVSSLRAQKHPDSKVLVVDNGSRDGSGAGLAALQPSWWTLRLLPVNLGFAGGMNVGLRFALRQNFDYVWLVNNDAFPEPDCLSILIAYMDSHPRVAISTPRLVGADGNEQPAGAYFNWSTGENHTFLSQALSSPRPDGTWLTGTAMLVRNTAISQIGFLDKSFFAYWEDADLSLRMTRAGYDIRAVPDATCVHLGTSSTGGGGSRFSNYLLARNAIRFLRKHTTNCQFARTILPLVKTVLNDIGILMVIGRQGSAEASLRGLRSGLLGESGTPKRLLSPCLGERVILGHPWRFCSLLGGLS